MRRMLALVLAALLALSALTALAEVDKAMVKQVQEALNAAGYDCGTPDGAAGKRTRAAIQSYRRDKGLPDSTEIDDALMQALGLNETVNASAIEEESPKMPDSSEQTIAQVEVSPALPAEIIENYGGIPNTVFGLADHFDVENLKPRFEQLNAISSDLMNSLLTTGSCTLPEFILKPIGGYIAYKTEPNGNRIKEVQFSIESTEGGTLISLAEPAPQDAGIKNHWVSLQTAQSMEEVVFTDYDYSYIEFGYHRNGENCETLSIRSDGYTVDIHYNEQRWTAYYNMDGVFTDYTVW